MKRKYRNLIVVLFVLLAACITICFIPISVKSFIPTVEQKVSEDLGINIRLDKLILRLGPSLKLKTPVMHMMYEDGQKFGQFDNVRIFIPWTSLLK